MRTVLLSLLLLLPLTSYSQMNIGKVNFKNVNSKNGKLLIDFNGRIRKSPELSVKGNQLTIVLPESSIKKTVNEKFSIYNKLDFSLNAKKGSNRDVIITANLPYALSKMKNKVSMTLKENIIEVTIPKVIRKGSVAVSNKIAPEKKQTHKRAVVKKTSLKKEKYDEKYLDYLLEQKEKTGGEEVALSDAGLKNDAVTTILSASARPEKEEPGKKQFSVMKYLGKYVAFLGVVLLLLYGVVFAMKKGVLKKGSLGLLKRTDSINVISTTYVGPKRSLLTVKVYDRILLLGSSDSGLTFITELDNVSGVIKEGEAKLTGSNFDNAIQKINEDRVDQKIKMKENPFAGAYEQVQNQEPTKSAENKVSFSSQVKEKIKGLKPLQ